MKNFFSWNSSRPSSSNPTPHSRTLCASSCGLTELSSVDHSRHSCHPNRRRKTTTTVCVAHKLWSSTICFKEDIWYVRPQFKLKRYCSVNSTVWNQKWELRDFCEQLINCLNLRLQTFYTGSGRNVLLRFHHNPTTWTTVVNTMEVWVSHSATREVFPEEPY